MFSKVLGEPLFSQLQFFSSYEMYLECGMALPGTIQTQPSRSSLANIRDVLRHRHPVAKMRACNTIVRMNAARPPFNKTYIYAYAQLRAIHCNAQRPDAS
jgi:hypothetical protein